MLISVFVIIYCCLCRPTCCVRSTSVVFVNNGITGDDGGIYVSGDNFTLPDVVMFGPDGQPLPSAPPLYENDNIGGGVFVQMNNGTGSIGGGATNAAFEQIRRMNDEQRRRNEVSARHMQQQVLEMNRRNTERISQQLQADNAARLRMNQQMQHQQWQHIRNLNQQIHNRNLQQRIQNEQRMNHQMHMNKIHQQMHRPPPPPVFKPPGVY